MEEKYSLEDKFQGKTLKELVETMPAEIQKLINNIDYDAKELERLHNDMAHTLEIDKEYKTNLIDKIFRRKVKRDKKKYEYRKERYARIRKAMEINNILVLVDEVCSNTSLLTIRDRDAEFRYQLRSIVIMPGATFIRGSLEECFKQLSDENKEMKKLALEIQQYLKTVDLEEAIDEIERASDF